MPRDADYDDSEVFRVVIRTDYLKFDSIHRVDVQGPYRTLSAAKGI